MFSNNAKIEYSNGFTTIREDLGDGKIKSVVLKGRLTDKYDGIRCKRFGEVIEVSKFLDLISREGLLKEDRYMMIYQNMRQMKACTSLKSLNYYKEWAAHMIPNGFYKWNDKGNENLRHIRWMVFDFELRKSDGSKFMPQEVYQIFTDGGLEPTFIAPSRSRQLWHVYVAHTEMTGHTESIYLHQRIQRYWVEKFDCDAGAIGPAHSFAIPKKVWFFGLVVHDVEELKQQWISYLKKKNEEDKARKKLVSYKQEQIWKHDAIQKLMNCEFNGSRMHACFTLALLFYAMGKSKEEAYAFLGSDWYRDVQKMSPRHFYPSDLKKALKSAFSGKYRGPKREYIEALTGVEFNLNIYGDRVRKVDPRTDTYRKTKNENILAIVDFIRDRGGEVTMFQKDIIAQLQQKGFAKRSLERHFKKLQDDGVITANEARGGRNAKAPTYRLLETEMEEHQTVIEYDNTYREPNRFFGVKNPLLKSTKIS